MGAMAAHLYVISAKGYVLAEGNCRELQAFWGVLELKSVGLKNWHVVAAVVGKGVGQLQPLRPPAILSGWMSEAQMV